MDALSISAGADRPGEVYHYSPQSTQTEEGFWPVQRKLKRMNDKESKGKQIPDNVQEISAGADQGPGSVDKIRDILFGAQIKTYETRFARLEESLARELTEQKEATRRRLESLEGFFRKETESLATRLKSEREERTDSLKALARDLKQASEELSKKILALDNKSAEGDSGLRQELMQESRKLAEEIRHRSESLTSLVDRRSSELRDQKVDRSALASLLTEVAMELSEESVAAKPAKSAKAVG
jgi:hypothetical protein